MNRILVTGANGFIGRAFVDFLRSRSFEVAGLSSLDGDIADPATMSRVDEKFAHVYHLAGRTFVPDSWDDSFGFYNVNVLGTANVLEYCRRLGVPLTFVSTYVYGHPQSLPIDETAPAKPSNPYALSKYLAERMCEFHASAYGLPVTVIRPFNVYGFGQDKRYLLPLIISQVLNEPVITVNDLLPRRDYVYIKDLVSALYGSLGHANGYQVYNVASGYSLSVGEVIDVVQRVARTDKPVVSREIVRKDDVLDVVGDIGKIRNDYDWFPEYDFMSGIVEMINAV